MFIILCNLVTDTCYSLLGVRRKTHLERLYEDVCSLTVGEKIGKWNIVGENTTIQSSTIKN